MTEPLGSGLSRLVHDPDFVTWLDRAERPNLFRIVGRTYTETWHSAFLGWLLDPAGSHGLGAFPLRRLLHGIAESAVVQAVEGPALVRQAAMFGEFGVARARCEHPINVGSKGKNRLDVFVDGIVVDGSEVVLVIEQKVGADADTAQCRRYSEWLQQAHPGKKHVAVLLAPVDDSPESPVDDERWSVLNYQVLHDEVLTPVLQRPLDPTIRTIIEQYVDVLRFPMNGTKLAHSQEEREIATRLYKQHKAAFDAMFEVLAESNDDPNLAALLEAERASARLPMVIEVDGARLQAVSCGALLKLVVEFLDKNDALPSLPFASGPKRYLLAAEQTHPAGNAFQAPVAVKTKAGTTLYIESNISRLSCMKLAQRLLINAGFKTIIGAEGTAT